MKKFFILFVVLVSISQTVFAFGVDTTEWICAEPGQLKIEAAEIDLKSDLKSDYRLYQTNISNKTNSTLDITVPTNYNIDKIVNEILSGGLKIKELMQVPKEIAVESYKEDVGEGTIAKAHKGLIYLTTSAGAAVAGAGLIGIYPQQKLEEYFSHKKIKKEYNKLKNNLFHEFVLGPQKQKDVMILVPIDHSSCLINVRNRDDDNDVYSDYHQQ